MKVLRIILWGMLGFVFLRGVISCIRPDRTSEVAAMIQDFKQEFYGSQDTNYEILGFAQNFIQEYLTYSVDGEKNFMERISPYVSDRIEKMEDIYDFKSSCEVSYVEAYRKETISDCQVDVYVKAKAVYSTQKNGTTTKKIKDVVLKVPVYTSNSDYIIEDLPMFVNDTMQDFDYKGQEYSGKETDSDAYKESVENFLEAYYGEDQNVVNYFLSSDADQTKFYCLGGSYQYKKINEIRAYKLKNSILCTVNFLITDQTNGAEISQDLNLTLVQDGKRLYVKDINTKIVNLEEEK